MMANDCTAPESDWACTWRQPPSQSTCSACTNGDANCGPDTADFSAMRKSLEVANSALQPLGVQFYLSRIEKYKMPKFWNVEGSTSRSWAQVKHQLRLVYPSLSLSAFVDGEERTESQWLHAAAIRAGEPGYGDFVVLDPDRMEWLRYNSQAGGSFAQQALLVLGERGAIPL